MFYLDFIHELNSPDKQQTTTLEAQSHVKSPDGKVESRNKNGSVFVRMSAWFRKFTSCSALKVSVRRCQRIPEWKH